MATATARSSTSTRSSEAGSKSTLPRTLAGSRWGDFTGDGTLELVVAGQSVDIHRHDDGLFNLRISHSANGNLHTAEATADFSGDGNLDAVISDADRGTVSVMIGNGDGTLTYAGAFATGSSLATVAVGEFNGDGRWRWWRRTSARARSRCCSTTATDFTEEVSNR